MPNWCQSIITFHGKNAKKLGNLIDEWTKEKLPEVSDYFGKDWLGNCLVNSGIMNFNEVRYGDIRCRGSIDYVEYTDEEELTMETSSAWGPAITMWRMINDKLNLDLDIVYTAEEPGCELYWTNDPCVEGTWMFEMLEGQEYEVSEEWVRELFEEFVRDHECVDKEVTENAYYATTDGDDYFNAHKYIFVDDDESL